MEQKKIYVLKFEEKRIYECLVQATSYEEAVSLKNEVPFDMCIESKSEHTIDFLEADTFNGNLNVERYSTLYNPYGTLTLSMENDSKEFPHLMSLFTKKSNTLAVDLCIERLTELLTTDNKTEIMKEIKTIFHYESVIVLS